MELPYRRLLSNRSVRRLWYAQAISVTGDWLIVSLVIQLAGRLSGGSSSAVGALMSVKILPALLLGAVIGVLVDRYNRKRTMIVADVARAALVMSLIFVHQLWAIYAVVFLTETFSLCFIPAKNATVPNIVPEEQLAEANSLSYTTDQIFMVIGLTQGAVMLAVFDWLVGALRLSRLPILGVFLPRFLGAQAGLTLDVLSFLASALLISSIALPRTARNVEPLTPDLFGRDVREGFRFLRENRSLRLIMLGISMAAIGVGTIYAVGWAYTVDVLHYGQGGAGFAALMGVFAFGMLVGAVSASPLGKRFDHARILTVGLFAFGAALLAFSLATHAAVVALIAVFGGASMAILYVSGWTYMQESVQDELRGRVFVTLEVLLRISLLVSLTLSGVAADYLRGLLDRAHVGVAFFNGPRITLFAGACVIIAAAVLMTTLVRRPTPSAAREEPA